MRNQFLLVLLMLGACTYHQPTVTETALYKGEHAIAYIPMENLLSTPFSQEAASSCTEAILDRLKLQTTPIAQVDTVKKAKQEHFPFLVSTHLIQYEQVNANPTELAIGIQLKVLDLRSDPPHILYQEVITDHTLLPQPLSADLPLTWNNSSFRLSPLGLAYAKLSREIVAYIEDAISHAPEAQES